jgi:DNA repair ATPase RecN
VSKEDGVAVVRPVEGEDRVAELARMLWGSTGEMSLAHARELMEEEGATVRTATLDEESRTPATR